MISELSREKNSDIQLMHGECLAEMAKLDDQSVDLVLTDLPYGEVNRKSSGLRNLDKGLADVCTIDLDKLVAEYARICSGSVYLFCGIEQVSGIRRSLVESGFSTRLGVWEKTNPSPMNGTRMWLSSVECCVFGRKPNAVFNEHCKGTVWRTPSTRSKVHPTQKPVALMERLILASSNPGMTVLDNCMGSGTTGVACVNTDRKFIGIEQDAAYYAIGCKRIQKAIDNKVLVA